MGDFFSLVPDARRVLPMTQARSQTVVPWTLWSVINTPILNSTSCRNNALNIHTAIGSTPQTFVQKQKSGFIDRRVGDFRPSALAA